jgi:ribosomal protein S18 acetylase RimI-like enzyme
MVYAQPQANIPQTDMAIRPIRKEDFGDWLALWNGNNQGQNDAKVTAFTWARLNDEGSPVNGLVAEVEGRCVALLHYVLHPTTGHLADVCYLQDVYVDPAYRQRGLAKALIQGLAALAQSKGWARVYWLAEQDNQPAQMLYKSLGVRLNFSLHVLPVPSSS